MWNGLHITDGDTRSIARAISLVENEARGFEDFLSSLRPDASIPITGITGPPGAGKSTLVNALIQKFVEGGKKIAIICVDPSSPFNLGAVLGDRIRMNEWYTHPSVYIRSLATRGSMGGLHPKILEITEILKSAQFDHIILETVGVGQSEIEIAGLADTTVVVLVPEAGDEVQTMKAGLMEIADIFVVNKADRPDADIFVKNLRSMLAPAFGNHQGEIPIIKTIASDGTGVDELYSAVARILPSSSPHQHKLWLLAEKAYFLISQRKMKGISKEELRDKIAAQASDPSFNLYSFTNSFI